MAENKPNTGENEPQLNEAYMNRLFCTTKERVAYIGSEVFGGMGLGKYDVGSDLWASEIYNIKFLDTSKAKVALTIYDMVNDPLSAAIIDNMRTRWGKFKPFQYLALIPSIISGIVTCFLPILASMMGLDQGGRLTLYMILLFYNETVGAFFGGGGYIKNVFTPNPNERTSLLVSANFVGDLIKKFPSQIMGLLYDVLPVEKRVGTFTSMKTVIWVMAMVPTVYWYIVSKERVPQSEKPPAPTKSLLAVFKNRPLLIYSLSGLIDGINIGMGEDLYYDKVLSFNLLPTIAGIPGGPVSYASYAFVPKFRARFSTKSLWFFTRGSIIFSEGFFFLFGLIGGKEHGFYLNKWLMTLAFGIGNMVEMVFYATKGIIGTEINYEVLDYCEWKNGYRVEATITLITGYFNKIKDAALSVFNSWLLENWAGFQVGGEVQTADTKWKLFLIAFGPHLIFDLFSLIPMVFYNIDKPTREKMYLELERSRAKRAAEEKLKRDREIAELTAAQNN